MQEVWIEPHPALPFSLNIFASSDNLIIILKKSKITTITLHVYVTVDNSPPSTLHASSNQITHIGHCMFLLFPKDEEEADEEKLQIPS